MVVMAQKDKKVRPEQMAQMVMMALKGRRARQEILEELAPQVAQDHRETKDKRVKLVALVTPARLVILDRLDLLAHREIKDKKVPQEILGRLVMMEAMDPTALRVKKVRLVQLALLETQVAQALLGQQEVLAQA